MHLYEKRNNNIGVYDLISDEKVIRNYRISEMEKIPEDERVFYAVNCIESGWPLFESYLKENLNSLIFDCVYADNDAPIGRDYDDRQVLIPTEDDYVLKNYYLGKFKDKDATRIRYFGGDIKYYILTEKSYNSRWYGKNGNFPKLDGIIQVPKSLFNLQLIENGNYYLLPTDNALEQLDLFKLKCIDEIGLNETKKYNDVTEEKIKEDAKVLKLLKK